jgi:hypothetical protein
MWETISLNLDEPQPVGFCFRELRVLLFPSDAVCAILERTTKARIPLLRSAETPKDMAIP